ncbi:MAG: helix-turn-helix transcriptional regulator [Clostridia bacterium]|nr:helix-turn-helix transcriptional regulator [Clostridia bacterium]
MNIANATSQRISELLHKNKMTQYRLSKITCISNRALIGIMKNRTKDINSSTVFLIASAFGLTIEQFYASPLFDPENIDA